MPRGLVFQFRSLADAIGSGTAAGRSLFHAMAGHGKSAWMLRKLFEDQAHRTIEADS